MTLKINVLASWAAHLVTIVTAVVLVPFVLGVLGDSQYGLWVMLMAAAGYSRLLYLGFGETICKYTAQHVATKDWDALNRVASCTFGVYLSSATLALLAGGLLTFALPYLADWGAADVAELRWVAAILTLNVAVGIAGAVFGGLLMGLQRFDIERGVLAFITLARLILTLVLLRSENGLITLAAIFLGVSVLENGLVFYFARKLVPTLRLRRSFVDRATLRETFGFSAYTSTGLVAEVLVYMTDALVIGFAISTAAVAPYAIAMQIVEKVRQPLIQIGIVTLPRAGQLRADLDDAELKRLVVNALGLSFLLAAGFFIGATFFGDLLISLWVGEGYALAGWAVLCVLAFAQVFALPCGIMRKLLVGVGEAKTPSLVMLVEAFANLILSVILVQFFGILGVALGTLIPILILEAGVLLPLGLRQFRVSPAEAFHGIVRPNLLPLAGLAATAASIDAAGLEPSWPLLFAATAAGGFVLMGLRFGFVALASPRQLLRGGLS